MKIFIFAVLVISNLSAVVAHTLRHRKLQTMAGETIPGQFIVELYPKYNPREEATGLLKSSQSGNSAQKIEVTSYYNHTINGFAMKNFPEAKLSGFINNPQVKAVWRVSDMHCCYLRL
jgi:hypothetical protein